jgi:hypothetical protein
MEHTKHIWRAILLLMLVGVVGFVARHLMIPVSFGQKGFYRYDSLKDYMSQPVVHGDTDACRSCHQTVWDTAKKGKHAPVSCEECHGPLAAHVTENAKSGQAQVDRTYRECAMCHQQLVARPKKHPQVDPTAHLVKIGAITAGEPIPEGICITCHDPHNPGLK